MPGPHLWPVLLTSLLEAADRVDSTTGLQMAYLKQWAPRASPPLVLRVPDLMPGPGRAVRGDACDLAGSAAARPGRPRLPRPALQPAPLRRQLPRLGDARGLGRTRLLRRGLQAPGPAGPGGPEPVQQPPDHARRPAPGGGRRWTPRSSSSPTTTSRGSSFEALQDMCADRGARRGAGLRLGPLRRRQDRHPQPGRANGWAASPTCATPSTSSWPGRAGPDAGHGRRRGLRRPRAHRRIDRSPWCRPDPPPEVGTSRFDRVHVPLPTWAATTGFATLGGRRAERVRNGGRAMGALDGRVAIMTGAGRGIGREHALLFAAEGAKRGRERPRRGGRRDRRRPHRRPAGGRRDHRRRGRGRGQHRRRRRLGRRPSASSRRPSTPSATCTCWSTTPASCATECWSTCRRPTGTRSSTSI